MALPQVGDGYQFSDGNPNEAKKVGGTAMLFSGGVGVYGLDTPITADTTTTTAVAGSLAIPSNSTGRGKLFVSDGSKWQFAAIS
jgi:hypothetical protein